MIGRTPRRSGSSSPLKDGVIADFEMTERMLGYFIARTQRWLRTVLKPQVVIGVPAGITQVERRAVRDSARHAGAREVYLVEEPVAAAIGAGLPVQEPGGNLIVDIGGGTTEVAVISLAGVIFCTSVRVAGDGMNEAILQHIRKHYNLLIGERQAEDLKLTLGSACPSEGPTRSLEVKGPGPGGRHPEDDHPQRGRDPGGAPRARHDDHRDHPDLPGADSARAGGRPGRLGPRADGRWKPPARTRPAPGPGDAAPREGRPGPDVLRGPRSRADARRNRPPQARGRAGVRAHVNSWVLCGSRSILGPMTVLIPARPAYRSTLAPSRPALFIVSRDLPERFNSLAFAFDGDRGVRVIFDRRRTDRRREDRTPVVERRKEDRRSADRDGTMRLTGWVQVDPE